MTKRMAAEVLGTFWLVMGGPGAGLLAAKFLTTPDNVQLGIGFVGVAIGVGLAVMTGAYALGPISGGHFNPAVTLGLVVGKRFPASEVAQYWIAQAAGAILAGFVIFLIASGRAGYSGESVISNGYGDHSPGGFSLFAALVAEVLLTAMFLIVILGVTAKRAAAGFAPLAIGLCLTIIHLISIPITATSVNPARSIGTALFSDAWALGQLWLFIVAPLAGGALGGFIYNTLLSTSDD